MSSYDAAPDVAADAPADEAAIVVPFKSTLPIFTCPVSRGDEVQFKRRYNRDGGVVTIRDGGEVVVMAMTEPGCSYWAGAGVGIETGADAGARTGLVLAGEADAGARTGLVLAGEGIAGQRASRRHTY